MSPTHPINMSSIGLKLMKIEQIKKVRFYFPVTVCQNDISEIPLQHEQAQKNMSRQYMSRRHLYKFVSVSEL
eukprot:UN20593